MSLTRKQLKAMGLTDEQVDSIVELHGEVVEGLKAERDSYKSKADRCDEVEKELNELKEAANDGYKEKYEKEHGDFEAYKKEVTAKETRDAKIKAVKAYFESKKITGANLDIALRGVKDEIEAVELDGEKIKDTKSLDDLVNGTFSGLVVNTSSTGAKTGNPPESVGGKKTKDEIMAIKDDRERQIAIAENLDLFNN